MKTKCQTNTFLFSSLAFMLLTPFLHAAITELHLYSLGETGSYTGTPDYFARDTVGSAHFGFGDPIRIADPDAGTPIPNAGRYSTWDGSDWQTAAATLQGVLPTNSYVIELWTKASNTTQYSTLFSTGTGQGGLGFVVANGKWNFYGGGDNWSDMGAVTANTWTHLAAVVNNAGQTLFYRDGTYTGWADTSFIHSQATLGHGEKGDLFSGALDQIRIFSYVEGTDDPIAAFNIPEPSTFAFISVFSLFLICRSFKRRP